MCDTNKNNRKCGGGQGAGGVPEIRPGWLKCPPNIMERSYPVPDGVDIVPISQGGRNGPSNNKKQFKCGQCGQDNRPKPDVKPNVAADCPMMKARCPGALDKIEGKGGSILDRIKNFFGIGKDDLRLAEACKVLKVPDDQIRHHRDVFDTPLVCRKDGYFSPLLTKVDCQGKEGCDCGGDEDVEEEIFDDIGEEYYEEEDYEYEEYAQEEYCEDEDEMCEDEPPMAMAAGDGGVKVENMICMCTCNNEPVQQLPQDQGDVEFEVVGGEGEKVEEECVEDAEGECVLEESAECMDPECKFFFEDQDDKKRKKEDFSKVGVTPDEDCIAMNNFIVRVQSPFSDTTTNETVEQIIARLTTKKLEYPEPGPRPEKDKQDQSAGDSDDKGKATVKEEVQLVVKQISVEDPTCECSPSAPWPCNKKKPPPQEMEKEDSSIPPPPPSPPPVDSTEPPIPPPPPSPFDDECNDVPPPPSDFDVPPPPPDCECGCASESNEQPQNDEKLPPAAPSPSPDRPIKPFQNDCETLTEEELLKKPIKEIKCGCPKPVSSSSDCPGTRYGLEASVWTPPPPPPCPRCGAPERGGTEDCYLCHLTRRMRSGLPEIREDPRKYFGDFLKVEKKAEVDSCTPEYLEDGSMKYKGGMCMSLSGSYLWHIVKRTPAGGFFDRYTGECGEDVRLQAITGTSNAADAYSACYIRKGEGLSWRGGDTIENTNRFLWGEKPIEEELAEKDKRNCKPPPPKETPKPPAVNQCPAPPKD